MRLSVVEADVSLGHPLRFCLQGRSTRNDRLLTLPRPEEVRPDARTAAPESHQLEGRLPYQRQQHVGLGTSQSVSMSRALVSRKGRFPSPTRLLIATSGRCAGMRRDLPSWPWAGEEHARPCTWQIPHQVGGPWLAPSCGSSDQGSDFL